MRRRRIAAAVGAGAAVAAGLLVHVVLPDSHATDIAGDALYAAAVYLGLVLVAPRLHPVAVGALAAGWCVAVELFQLTGLPEQWGARFAPVTLVLGTVFDPRDLVVYTVVVAVVLLVDLVLRRVRGRGSAAGG